MGPQWNAVTLFMSNQLCKSDFNDCCNTWDNVKRARRQSCGLRSSRHIGVNQIVDQRNRFVLDYLIVHRRNRLLPDMASLFILWCFRVVFEPFTRNRHIRLHTAFRKNAPGCRYPKWAIESLWWNVIQDGPHRLKINLSFAIFHLYLLAYHYCSKKNILAAKISESLLWRLQKYVREDTKAIQKKNLGPVYLSHKTVKTAGKVQDLEPRFFGFDKPPITT